MVDLSEAANFGPVSRIEQSDAAIGGNETSPPNLQNKQLADRDKWLYDAIASLGLTPTSTTEEIKQALAGDAIAATTEATTLTLAAAGIAQGRLSLAAGDPTPIADITGATTLYYTPYNGDLISIYNDTQNRWETKTFTERSLSLSGLAADTNFDIFLYNNAGTLTLETVAWSNSGAGTGARASAISRLNGIWVKTTDNRRYLGTIRTTSTGESSFDLNGTTGSPAFVGVFNAQNRVALSVNLNITSPSFWSYITAAWRAVAADTSHRIDAVFGLRTLVRIDGFLNIERNLNFAIGLNRSNDSDAKISGDTTPSLPDVYSTPTIATFVLDNGFNEFYAIEYAGDPTGTPRGAASNGSRYRSGMIANWEG